MMRRVAGGLLPVYNPSHIMESDLVLFKARIHTLDRRKPQASAVAIRGSRIVFVGRDGDALRNLCREGQAVDLGGRCVVPGLTDAHFHLRWYAESFGAVEAGAPTLDEALKRVEAAARLSPPGQWITGTGWDHNLWQALPTRAQLDRVAPANPVALKAKSGHALWASSIALKAAGITASTADPADGRILRQDSSGEPTGILLENAMDMVQAVIPKPSPQRLAEMMRTAQETLHRLGLTGVHDYDSSLLLSALELLDSRGGLTLRVVKGIPSELLGQAAELGLRSGFGSRLLSLGALKIFADGALGPQTAWMLESYEGSSSRGIPTVRPEELAAMVSRANAAGISCAVHAIGDAACRAALDAFQAAASEASTAEGISGLRNRIEHAQLLHPADLARFARLGVVASMQPIHATSDMLIAERYWGDRCVGAYAWRSLLDSGASIAFGSDCPVETPNPLAGIHAAVTRRRSDGSPGPQGWRPAERISVEEALRGYTTGAAYAAGRERDLGSISPGKLADLTLLDEDIFETDPHAIKDVKAVGTIVDGRFVFRSF
jgi:predicted amidohydrolase YtcJ